MNRRGKPEWNTRVRSNIAVGAALQPWEAEVLGATVSNLLDKLLSDTVKYDGKAEDPEASSSVRASEHR